MRSGAADEVRRRAQCISTNACKFPVFVFARHPDGLGFVLRSVKPKQSKTKTRQDLKIVKRLLMRSGAADEVRRRARNASRQVMDVLQDFQSSFLRDTPADFALSCASCKQSRMWDESLNCTETNRQVAQGVVMTRPESGFMWWKRGSGCGNSENNCTNIGFLGAENDRSRLV